MIWCWAVVHSFNMFLPPSVGHNATLQYVWETNCNTGRGVTPSAAQSTALHQTAIRLQTGKKCYFYKISFLAVFLASKNRSFSLLQFVSIVFIHYFMYIPKLPLCTVDIFNKCLHPGSSLYCKIYLWGKKVKEFSILQYYNF